MKPDIFIRPLLAGDEDEVVEMVHGDGGVGVSPAFNWPEESLRPEARYEAGWGVWVDGVLAAYVIWRESGVVREISTLATHPSFRRAGLMRQLLKELFDAYGQSVWMLEVHEENHGARALYESMGFEFVHRRKAYYKDGKDAYLFRRSTL